ncbi:MAG: hypothetical protein ACYDCD_12280 [Candidatus Acidiferrales bacterium]
MTEESLLNEYIAEHDRILGTCDAYDVKASIWLAVIIFLAVQTGDMLGKGLPRCLLYGQWLSAVLLVAAGVFTLIELYPRDYKRYAPSNGVIVEWLTRLRERHNGEADAESVILHKTTSYRISWFTKMITDNKALNRKKANLLLLSFWTTAIAAGTNLTTLAILRLFFQSR